MSQVQTERFEIKTEIEPDTGASIEQISIPGADLFYPYFTQRLFSSDGTFLLASLQKEKKKWQPAVLNLQENTYTTFNTDKTINAHSGCIDPSGENIYFFAGGDLFKQSICENKTEKLYTTPEGYHPTTLSISSDGKQLNFAYWEKIKSSTETGKIYSSQVEQMFQKPRSSLMGFDLNDNAAFCIYGDHAWYSHICTSPMDKTKVMFCHEGPWQLVQRLWVADTTLHEVYPIIKQKINLERSGHEYFTSTGKVITQYAIRSDKQTDDWQHANIRVNIDDSDRETFWYDGIQPAHVQSAHHDDNKMVGDCGLRKTFQDTDMLNWLVEIELKDEKSIVKPLCRHNTSWLNQQSHPHPVFSPDDDWIYFNSDHGKSLNIYRVKTSHKH